MAMKDIMPWKKRRQDWVGAPFEDMRRFAESIGRVGAAPQVEIQEKPKEIVVSARLPGFETQDIQVDVTENTLTIRGAQSSGERQRKHGVMRRQEAHRSFYRSFTLPSAVKTEEVTARFNENTLEIRLPRLKETQIRRVDIQ